MVTRAQRIKKDREATEAFMVARPPTFDGSNPEKLREWMHKIRTRFTTCHIEEHLQVDFASAQLVRSAHWRKNPNESMEDYALRFRE